MLRVEYSEKFLKDLTKLKTLKIYDKFTDFCFDQSTAFEGFKVGCEFEKNGRVPELLSCPAGWVQDWFEGRGPTDCSLARPTSKRDLQVFSIAGDWGLAHDWSTQKRSPAQTGHKEGAWAQHPCPNLWTNGPPGDDSGTYRGQTKERGAVGA